MNNTAQTALAERKTKLLLDGVVYRIGVAHAKTAIVHGLRAESLIQHAVECVIDFAGARSEAPTAARLQTLIALAPLAVAAFSTFSNVSRKKWFKPAVFGAALTTATVIAVLVKRCKRA